MLYAFAASCRQANRCKQLTFNELKQRYGIISNRLHLLAFRNARLSMEDLREYACNHNIRFRFYDYCHILYLL